MITSLSSTLLTFFYQLFFTDFTVYDISQEYLIRKVTPCVVTEHTVYFSVTTFSECSLLARGLLGAQGKEMANITWQSRDSPSGRGHSEE